jgi:hypothetical protein
LPPSTSSCACIRVTRRVWASSVERASGSSDAPLERHHAFLGLDAARLVALAFGRGLAQQEIDLGQLAFERRLIGGELIGELRESLIHESYPYPGQSSGMRIQPCFMA